MVGGLKASVIEVPGHTAGHIAYYFKANELLFAGDTLFALGCGRPFEAPPRVLYNSLIKLARLPGCVEVYCGTNTPSPTPNSRFRSMATTSCSSAAPPRSTGCAQLASSPCRPRSRSNARPTRFCAPKSGGESRHGHAGCGCGGGLHRAARAQEQGLRAHAIRRVIAGAAKQRDERQSNAPRLLGF